MLDSVQWWMYPLGFLLLLGPLVTLHELGHYLVGRWFGVKAVAFSVGFGREVFGFTDRRGTRWKLSALPLGGYVQFAGDMNPASEPSAEWLALPPEERAQTFPAKPLWQKALIVAAGPVTNFLIAIAILAAFNLSYGRVLVSPEISAVTEGSAAEAAGIRAGDTIVSLDGRAIEEFTDVQQHVITSPGSRIALGLERDGATRVIDMIVPSQVMRDRFGNESRIGRLGIMAAGSEIVPVGPVESVGLAVVQTGDIMVMMVRNIKQIITGIRPVSELGGPIKMAKFSGEQLTLGWPQFVSLVAMVSINLAFINLLPIPVLDGGHLAFYAAEAIRRRPASARSQEWAFRTGLAFVLALMLFVTINDIASLPWFGG